jgi:cytosine/adenosine deaminase-related metal-dependent hydrolase
MAGEIGQLVPGAAADMIAIPARGSLRDVYQAIVAHEGAVSWSMIDGRVLISASNSAKVR